MTDGLDARLEERLQRLHVEGPSGDWLDVRRRAAALGPKRRARRRTLLLLAATLVVVALVAIPAAGLSDRVLGVFSVAGTEERPASGPVPSVEPGSGAPPFPAFVYGSGLRGVPGGPQPLAGRLGFEGDPGHQSRAAVPSPDGRLLLYQSIPRFTPSIRLHDLENGRSTVFARGAASFAWRGDGTIAYWQRTKGRFTGIPLGHVFVRDGVEGSPVQWTAEPTVYTVLAWAGETLLVHAGRCLAPDCAFPGIGEGTIFALDGPGRMRPAGVDSLTAVSPEGRYLVGTTVLGGEAAGTPTPIRVVEAATSRIVAELPPEQVRIPSKRGTRLELAVADGSWAGDRIVGIAQYGSPAILAVLRFDGDRLEFERFFRLGRLGRPGEAPPGVLDPIFLDDADRYVIALANVPIGPERTRFHVVRCDLERDRCSRGRRLPPGRLVTLVHNPSRPLAPEQRTLSAVATRGRGG